MTLKNRRFALLSPFLIIAVGHVAARVFFRLLGVWAWVPLQLVYWFAIVSAIYAADAFAIVAAAYRRSSGRRWWLLGIATGIIPLPILLLHLNLLRMKSLVACWLLIALINPVLEESFWRCLLGEATARWPGWLAGLYSAALFTIAHPLLWGVFSIGNRNWQAFASLMVMGFAWSVIYRRTRSLRVSTFSHTLVDLGNMTVWVFLNLYVPPHS